VSVRGKSRRERLFSAAVLRRSFDASGPSERSGFALVYEGVLRDLGLTDAEVVEYLAVNGAEVDAAIGRRRGVA
jgi:hypothetical protein